MTDDTSAELCESFRKSVSETSCLQGRRHTRRDFYGTLLLTEINGKGFPLRNTVQEIVGKDISEAGMGFSHKTSLGYRRAIISLDDPDIGQLAVEAKVLWTKLTPLGIYESGCRFIRRVEGHNIRCE